MRFTHVGLAKGHQLQMDQLAERRLQHGIQLIGDEGLAVGAQRLVVHENGNLNGYEKVYYILHDIIAIYVQRSNVQRATVVCIRPASIALRQ